jgi:hypothetical protein
VVSLVSPGVEVQTDRTWTLPELGQITSTTGSHGNIKRYRGVHAIDCAFLDGKSGTEVLQKHPHPTINSRGGREGWVSLGVSIEAGKEYFQDQDRELQEFIRSVCTGCSGEISLSSRQETHGRNKTTSRPFGHHWAGGSGQHWITGFVLSITQDLSLISICQASVCAGGYVQMVLS